MELTSQRLIFRSYEEKDFGFLYSMLNDSEMVKYIGNGDTETQKKHLHF